MKRKSINSSTTALLILLFKAIVPDQLFFFSGNTSSISHLAGFPDCSNSDDAKCVNDISAVSPNIKTYSQLFNCQNENYETNCKIPKAILYE